MENAILQRIIQASVPSDGCGIFWFEQSHFALKTPDGAVTHLDPFLSRVLKVEKHLHPQSLADPAEVWADFVLLTHDHRDHTDPFTLGPMAQTNPACRFLGPPEACARCRACGIDGARLTEIREGERVGFGPFQVQAVYARDTSADPTGADATTHLGYVLETASGLKIYDVGDTHCDIESYRSRLAPLEGFQPDLMLVPINEGYSNPGPRGASTLVQITDPQTIVPCHFGCMKENTLDPALFVEALPALYRDRVRILSRGGDWTVRRTR
jgi:L-ascorbate metabolism protein UlaG (beta-lactamase superfamily)